MHLKFSIHLWIFSFTKYERHFMGLRWILIALASFIRYQAKNRRRGKAERLLKATDGCCFKKKNNLKKRRAYTRYQSIQGVSLKPIVFFLYLLGEG